MSVEDILRSGEEIANSTLDAINTGNYSEVKRSIRNVIDGGGDKNYWSVDTSTGYSRSSSTTRTQTTGGMSSSQRRSGQTGQTTYSRPAQEAYSPYVKNVPGKFSGLLLEIFGFPMTAFWGLALLGSTLSYMPGDLAFVVFIALMTLGHFAIGYAGFKRRALAKRFLSYVHCMKGKDYAAIDELARFIGKSRDFVLKDVKTMIRKRFFKEGRLDEKETTLLGTDAVYKQYLDMQASAKEREERESKEREAKEKVYNKPGMTEESKKLLEEGEAYIKHIRECNDAIPGEEISAKLSRLETIMTRIFKQVEVQPELAEDLHKFMNYYLPTTAKLVEAYREMDAQPVEGENISKTKREIEETLDTINEAFEKLLDSFFEEKAWDISSDINVMKNMMKNDGMTGSDFQTAARS